IVGLGLVWISNRQRDPSPVHAIVILPFENLSTEPGQEYFVDGMTDALITDLAQMKSLDVISHQTAMHYKGQHRPLPQLARELGVDAVLEGSVLRSGSKVRVNVRLVRAADDHHLWAQSYDRDVVGVIALQGEVAQAVAEAVAVAITSDERRGLSAKHVPPMD